MGKKIPLWQVGLVMLFTIGALCYSMDIFGLLAGKFGAGKGVIAALSCEYGELHIPLICSALVASVVAIINGYKWTFLEQGIIASINRSMQAMLILMTVGLLIGSWIAGGIVPAMIYYGLMILNPSIFLVAGCLICCIVSLATGSSWTTAGTIGIALIGVGQGLGVDPAMTAGAIVSGAYFGDKMSPLSDTTNLAPAIAGSNLFDHIKHMIWTVTPSLIIALVIFAVLGMKADTTSANNEIVKMFQESLTESFNINPALLIPPIVVIIIVALKLPALPGLMGGVILGCLCGSIFQGITLADWPGIVHYGFESTAGMGPYVAQFEDVTMSVVTTIMEGANIVSCDSSIDNLLTRGGMDSMLWTINLIICAMCFGGIMDASGMLASLAEALLRVVKSTGSLVTITVFSCFFVNVLAADQYLSIILPGRMYKEAFEDRRLDPKNLSRCLEDSGTITSCLVPWNTCGATMSTFLGVPTSQYWKYAYLNIVNPLVSIFYGFTGITMTKMSDEQYDKILTEREESKIAALKAMEG